MKIDVYLINALFHILTLQFSKVSEFIDINPFGKHGEIYSFYNLFSCSVLS